MHRVLHIRRIWVPNDHAARDSEPSTMREQGVSELASAASAFAPMQLWRPNTTMFFPSSEASVKPYKRDCECVMHLLDISMWACHVARAGNRDE